MEKLASPANTTEFQRWADDNVLNRKGIINDWDWPILLKVTRETLKHQIGNLGKNVYQ
jgi:hypothetical protein